jgi:hypothetical protein
MVKTAVLDNDTHMNIKDIQMILYRDYNIQMNISDILSFVLKDPDDVVKRIITNIYDEHENNDHGDNNHTDVT